MDQHNFLVHLSKQQVVSLKSRQNEKRKPKKKQKSKLNSRSLVSLYIVCIIVITTATYNMFLTNPSFVASNSSYKKLVKNPDTKVKNHDQLPQK